MKHRTILKMFRRALPAALVAAAVVPAFAAADSLWLLIPMNLFRLLFVDALDHVMAHVPLLRLRRVRVQLYNQSLKK